MTTLLGTSYGLSPWIESTVLSVLTTPVEQACTSKKLRGRLVQVESIPPQMPPQECPGYFYIQDGSNKIAVFFSPSALSTPSFPPRLSMIKLLDYHVSTLPLIVGHYSNHHPIIFQMCSDGNTQSYHVEHNRRVMNYPPILCLYATSIHVMEEGGSSMGLATSQEELLDVNYSMRVRQAFAVLNGNIVTKRILKATDESYQRHTGEKIYSMNRIADNARVHLNVDGVLNMLVLASFQEFFSNDDEIDYMENLVKCQHPELMKMLKRVMNRNNSLRRSQDIDEKKLMSYFQDPPRISHRHKTSFFFFENCFFNLLKAHPNLSCKDSYYYIRNAIQCNILPIVFESVSSSLTPPNAFSQKELCSGKELLQIVSDLYRRLENFDDLFRFLGSFEGINLTPDRIIAAAEQTLDMIFRSIQVFSTLHWLTMDPDEKIFMAEAGLIMEDVTENPMTMKKIRLLLAQTEIDWRQKSRSSNHNDQSLQKSTTKNQPKRCNDKDSNSSNLPNTPKNLSMKKTSITDQQDEFETYSEKQLETQPDYDRLGGKVDLQNQNEEVKIVGISEMLISESEDDDNDAIETQEAFPQDESKEKIGSDPKNKTQRRKETTEKPAEDDAMQKNASNHIEEDSVDSCSTEFKKKLDEFWEEHAPSMNAKLFRGGKLVNINKKEGISTQTNVDEPTSEKEHIQSIDKHVKDRQSCTDENDLRTSKNLEQQKSEIHIKRTKPPSIVKKMQIDVAQIERNSIDDDSSCAATVNNSAKSNCAENSTSGETKIHHIEIDSHQRESQSTPLEKDSDTAADDYVQKPSFDENQNDIRDKHDKEKRKSQTNKSTVDSDDNFELQKCEEKSTSEEIKKDRIETNSHTLVMNLESVNEDISNGAHSQSVNVEKEELSCDLNPKDILVANELMEQFHRVFARQRNGKVTTKPKLKHIREDDHFKESPEEKRQRIDVEFRDALKRLLKLTKKS